MFERRLQGVVRVSLPNDVFTVLAGEEAGATL